jgi:hypothetical protein
MPDNKFVRHVAKFLIPTTPPLKVGQIVILRDSHFPCHCGIIVSRGRGLGMIHSSVNDRGVAETDLDGGFWGRLQRVFEYPGVEED